MIAASQKIRCAFRIPIHLPTRCSGSPPPTHGRASETFLILREDDIVGACGFDLREGPEPELGYWIGAPYWSQGYATEAANAVVDYAFAVENHAALRAGARVTNPASRRVLEKCGFQWDGVELIRIHVDSRRPCRATASSCRARTGWRRGCGKLNARRADRFTLASPKKAQSGLAGSGFWLIRCDPRALCRRHCCRRAGKFAVTRVLLLKKVVLPDIKTAGYFP